MNNNWTTIQHKMYSKVILKCGFLKKSFIMNAPLCSLTSSLFGAFGACTTAKAPKSDEEMFNCTKMH